jgi:transposase
MEATISSNGSLSSEVPERAQRRKFGDDYKLRMVEQYDALPRGERGMLLRREGLYCSQIDGWRRQREAGVIASMATKRRGPQAAKGREAAQEKAKLQRKVARLERKLRQAELIIEIQKKVALTLKDLDEEEAEGTD